MTDTQIVDPYGNAISSKPKKRFLKMAFLSDLKVILTWVVLISAALIALYSIRQHLGWYKKPSISVVRLAHWGFYSLTPATKDESTGDSLYGYPTVQNPHFNKFDTCFHPSISFSIQNDNSIDMNIVSVAVDVERLPSPELKGVTGPMLTSSEMTDYIVTIKQGASDAEGNLIKEGTFLKLSPGESHVVRFFLQSEDAGLLRVKPKLIYTIGSKEAIAVGNHFSKNIYFFDNVPPNWGE